MFPVKFQVMESRLRINLHLRSVDNDVGFVRYVIYGIGKEVFLFLNEAFSLVRAEEGKGTEDQPS